MPLYDFQCSSCGHKSEVLRKISEPSIAECPNCHQQTFSKQLSAPNFQLNGTGWYATDFKDSKPKNAPKSDEANSKETQADSTKQAAACAPGCACH